MRRRNAAVALRPPCYGRVMGFIGALVGMIPVVLVAAGLTGLGHRDLPWYLGGVPDIELDPPQDRPVTRRRETR
jgi:hypothetical protein